ncbi:MAG: single-stranded-DNA-specific exonuclease RecJ [Deltaproteobacteria bacterium]|nr:single-stranded-DNA-specific exonuclease RecJ [Deltaproteobacteria bacterium]
MTAAIQRVWEIRERENTDSSILAQALDIPEVLAGLLQARGVNNPEMARRFLTPALSDLNDPSQMKDISLAVERLLEALRAGDQICIYGDYDVDGVTSVSLLLMFFRYIGLRTEFYIPSRLEEGYGLNPQAIEKIVAQGAKLLITVDCGISDIDEIEQAKAAGLDVIIIDHHQVPDQVPTATAILDPHQPECEFPFKELAAVGVAFNLVVALRTALRERGYFNEIEEPNLREFLDLVALGTIADIVALLDDNRIIAHFGLQELTAGRRPGVAALKEVSGILNDQVTVGHVAFRLAPRINAVGRLGQASKAVELLTTNSYSKALALARELDKTNKERQAIEQVIFKDALDNAEQTRQKGETRAMVLASKEWHIGVIGIVASKLLERFACPIVMIGLAGDLGKGSARGTSDIHLYEAFVKCADLLEGFGGHRAAAGLSIRAENVDAFRDAFLAAVVEQSSSLQAAKIIKVDQELQPAIWTNELVEKLAMLSPHGLGNPEPLFIARNVSVKSARKVGRDSPYHIKAVFNDDGRFLDGIGFSMGDRLDEMSEQVDLVYSAELNSWDGQTSVQLKLKDFKKVHP